MFKSTKLLLTLFCFSLLVLSLNSQAISSATNPINSLANTVATNAGPAAQSAANAANNALAGLPNQAAINNAIASLSNPQTANDLAALSNTAGTSAVTGALSATEAANIALPTANTAGAAVNLAEAAANTADTTINPVGAAATTASAAADTANATATNNTTNPNTRRYPPTALTVHLIEPYFYSNDYNTQVVGHLFCGTNNPTGVIQCAVYDGSNVATDRLLAIEYVINEATFNNLPLSEQRYWHSHAYGVQSGNIIAPDLSGETYTANMMLIANSYGKAVYVWSQTQALPIADPILAFGFTGPNQLSAPVSAAEDSQTNTTILQRAENNAVVTIPTPLPGADAWAVDGTNPVFTNENSTLPAGLWGLNFLPEAAQ